jgi:hypothetical protein
VIHPGSWLLDPRDGLQPCARHWAEVLSFPCPILAQHLSLLKHCHGCLLLLVRRTTPCFSPKACKNPLSSWAAEINLSLVWCLGFHLIKAPSHRILDTSLLPHQVYFLTISHTIPPVKPMARAVANKIRQSFRVPRLRGVVKGLLGPPRWWWNRQPEGCWWGPQL